MFLFDHFQVSQGQEISQGEVWYHYAPYPCHYSLQTLKRKSHEIITLHIPGIMAFKRSKTEPHHSQVEEDTSLFLISCTKKGEEMEKKQLTHICKNGTSLTDQFECTFNRNNKSLGNLIKEHHEIIFWFVSKRLGIILRRNIKRCEEHPHTSCKNFIYGAKESKLSQKREYFLAACKSVTVLVLLGSESDAKETGFFKKDADFTAWDGGGSQGF